MSKKKSLKIFYEAQLSCPEGRWGMTMTITRGDSTWTSPWFAFTGMRFQNFEEARQKAGEQFIALRTVLEDEPSAVNRIAIKPYVGRHRKEGEEDGEELLSEVRQEPEEP